MQTLVRKILPKVTVAEKYNLWLKKPMTKDTPILSKSDEELMHGYQAGEAMAFDILLSRHKKPLYNFIYRFLHNEQASEEAFQEVFMRVIRNRHEYRESAKFTTWIYTIARNFCIDELRKQRFRNHKPLETETDSQGDLHMSDEYKQSRDPQDFTIAKELEKHLENALTSLAVEQREVFLFRHFQNMPFEEIARISDISVNTVKSRMRYALQHIEKYFQSVGISGVNS